MIYLLYFFAALMVAAGINHFINPKFYASYMPSFFPKPLANIVAGFVEIAIGVMLFIPAVRSLGGLGVFLLMIIFLPLHVWDLFKEKPAIGSKKIRSEEHTGGYGWGRSYLYFTDRHYL